VFWIFLLSAVPHAPFAMRLHLNIGCSEEIRDVWRTLDVFFIFTCAGEQYFLIQSYVCGWLVVTCTVYRPLSGVPRFPIPRSANSDSPLKHHDLHGKQQLRRRCCAPLNGNSPLNGTPLKGVYTLVLKQAHLLPNRHCLPKQARSPHGT